MSCTCIASDGLYLGGQLGWANVHQGEFITAHYNKLINKILPTTHTTPLTLFFNNTGLAESIFLGYALNSYFALEVGYHHFKPLHVKGNVTIDLVILKKLGIHLPIDLNTTINVETYAVEFMAKGTWPITNKFSLYGKLGLAYLDVEADLSMAAKTDYVTMSLNANPNFNLFYPAAAIGVDYALNRKLHGDFSWLHIQKYNNRSFPNIDFIAIGLIYYFDIV